MNDWWAIVLLMYVSGRLRDPGPTRPTRTYMECDRCGNRYYGDPYYAPRHCDKCGGTFVMRRES